MSRFALTTPAFAEGQPIPARFAFGKPADHAPMALSDNLSPALSWDHVPEGTRSFALICVDPDVPSAAEDVNQPDREVPPSLARVPFYHWVLVDLPSELRGLPEGAGSTGISPGGKPFGLGTFGVSGVNSYTDWFAGDPEMAGQYGGYDGPCPPWNDSLIHHYHFRLFALDVPTLGLSGPFTGPSLLAAVAGHLLGTAEIMGTTTLNRRLL